MRALLALAAALVAGGCASILGIEDPVGDQCSPFDVTTCELDQTCDIVEGEVLTCRPEGGIPVGGICEGVGDLCGGALSCVQGICRTICGPARTCDAADGESSCILFLSASTAVCDSDCNVLDGTGCLNDVDEQCVPETNQFGEMVALCVPNGHFGNVAEGDDCTFLGECARGLGCDVIDGKCVPVCDAENPVCNNGGTCESIGRLHETLDVGLCRI